MIKIINRAINAIKKINRSTALENTTGQTTAGCNVIHRALRSLPKNIIGFYSLAERYESRFAERYVTGESCAKLHYTDTGYGHVVQHHLERTTSCHFPTSWHVETLGCALRCGKCVVQLVVELLWACPLVVLYNMSVAGVRVVEFGTKYTTPFGLCKNACGACVALRVAGKKPLAKWSSNNK